MKKKVYNKKIKSPEPEKTFSERSLKIRLSILLSLLAFLLYANTLGHFYALDDLTIITSNKYTQQGINGIPEILTTSYWHGFNASTDLGYRPLSLIMFAIEWELMPADPKLSHWMNVLLFCTTAALIFLTLCRVTSNKNIAVAFFTTLLFVFHPVHTEVVANIKSRDELLSLFFSMLSLFLLFGYLKRPRLLTAGGIVVSGFLAMLSKENAITFLAVIPLTVYFFSDTPVRKNLQTTLFFAAGVGAYLSLRYGMLNGWSLREHIPLMDNALTAAANYSDRLATVFFVLGKYLLLFIYPHPLVSDYSFPHMQVVGWDNTGALLSLLIHLALAVYAITGFRKKNPAAYGILFYFVTISIVSNLFFLVGSTMSERFLYTPSLGIFLAFIFFLSDKLRKPLPPVTGTGSFLMAHARLLLILLIPLFLLSAKTVQRNRDWENNFVLFRADIASMPDNSRLYYFYGTSLIEYFLQHGVKSKDEKETLLREAVRQQTKATELSPGFDDAWGMLGLAWYHLGDLPKAIQAYETGLKIHPKHSNTMSNYGLALMDSGNPDRAIECFRKALEYRPSYAEAWNNMGVAFTNKGLLNEAETAYKNALKINPHYPDPMVNLGVISGKRKDFDKTITYMQEALKLSPGNKKAYYYIGLSYMELGDTVLARQYYNLSR